MLPSLQAKLSKAKKHNENLGKKSYAKKFASKMNVTSKVDGGFDSMFSSIEEKEAWLEKREEAKRNSHSTFH